MTRSLYAVHEGPIDWLDGVAGYVVLTVHAWQSDQVDVGAIVQAGHVPLVRMNNGYGDEGTIPKPDAYEAFAQRLGLVAGNSPEVHHWIVGNEPNHPQEWPGGERIYPDEYARCYSKCRQAIKAQPGHESDQVLVAAIAPWSAKVTYAGNERGDWVQYLADVVVAVGQPDGYALHTYTHEHDARQVTSMARMDPPFEDRYYQFLAYRDMLSAIPAGKPVYITECCPVDSGWLNVNNEWVQRVYAEIDAWNDFATREPIRCLTLYRGVPVDRWYFADKGYVRMDWDLAVVEGYTCPVAENGPGNGGNGGEGVALQEIFRTKMDEGDYDYQGVPEVTVPVGSVPLWEWEKDDDAWLVRPEYDMKDSDQGQPEVHSKPNACGFFSMNSTMEAALVWKRQVVPGSTVKASIWAMKDDSQNSGVALRLGIAVDDPGEGAIQVDPDPSDHPPGKFIGALESRAQWGGWLSKGHREWGRVDTPQIVATGDHVWVLANGRKDWPIPGHTHWDDLVVWSDQVPGTTPPTPPPTTCTGATKEEVQQIIQAELQQYKVDVRQILREELAKQRIFLD